MWETTNLHRLVDTRGAFLRREALAAGYDDKAIRRMVRAGDWVRVRHGAYTLGTIWSAAGDLERHAIAVRAVMRTLDDRVAVSHQSAAALHGMRLWDVPLEQAHVTRLDNGAGRTERDVVHHEGLCVDADVEQLLGLRVVRPVRAALETAHVSDVERGLVVADSGLHAGLFTKEELAAQHVAMEHWPSSRHLHLVTRLADGGSASVGESRTRYLFWSQGLPQPQLQFPVYAGDDLVGITDFAWPEHGLLGEFDGKAKYERHLRPGEAPGDAVFREKRREDQLRRVTGWAMVRIVWADLYEPARTAAYVRSMLRHAA